MDRGRAAIKAVELVMAERKGTRLCRVIHLGTRVKTRISSVRRATATTMLCKGKVVARRATAMRMRYRFKVVARRATAMMMVTRLWPEPGTRHMTLEWQIGWGLAHWTRTISV